MSQQPTTEEGRENDHSVLLFPQIPFPYLIAIPNVYYWKKAFNHIVGTLYISFDFLYFDGRESTINPIIRVPSGSLKNWSFGGGGSSSSSGTNNLLSNNNNEEEESQRSSSSSGCDEEKSTTPSSSSTTLLSNQQLSVVVLYEHVSSIVRENYLLKPCLCIKTNRDDGEKHYFYGLESIANTILIIEHASYLSLTSQLACKLIAIKQERPEVKAHSNKKQEKSKTPKIGEMSVKDRIEHEKDQMIRLAKKTKEINQDTLNEINYQSKELKETNENYLEPIKAYNALGSRLLTGMSWGGFAKNLWSYSKWKKIEKQALIFNEDIQRERSLDFNSLSFEVLVRTSDEKHYESFIAVIGSKTIDLLRDKKTRVILRQFDYKSLNGMKIINPFLFEMSFMQLDVDIIVLSVFSPFIVEQVRNNNRGLIIEDVSEVLCSTKYDPFKFYSKDSTQIVNISANTIQKYNPKTVSDKLENDKDAKLDYLYDIVTDIRDISEVTGKVITDSNEFLEDFISEVDDADAHIRVNIREINKRL